MYFESFQPQHYLIYRSLQESPRKEETWQPKKDHIQIYPIDPFQASYLKYKFYGQLYFSIKHNNKRMERTTLHRMVYFDKENDFKKGNKNREMELSMFHKASNHEKLYQSVSASIQLRPNFLRRKPMTNTGQFCMLYGEQILKEEQNGQVLPRCLAQHEIDAHLRAKMIDWMVEVTASYKFTNKTFFDGIQLMDRYFHAEQDRLPPSKLHIIGVEAMTIASKMNEVYPLRIRTVYEKIGHRKLPIDDLVAMQERIMKQLDYKLNSWTFFDLAMMKIAEFSAFEESQRDAMKELFPFNQGEKTNQEERMKKMEELCAFICRHLAFQYEFLCETSSLAIAESCVKAVLDIMGVSSIPSCFYSTSSITLKITKQRIFKIMKNFKTAFAGLNNLFKYTSSEVLEQVAQFAWN